MKTILLVLIAFMLWLPACKKDEALVEQPLLQDGPMSAQLGKMIYLGHHGFSTSTPVWGRNANELFFTASTGLIRLDLAAKKLELLDKFPSIATGKTPENSAVIFSGMINAELGFYAYHFSSNSFEKIMAAAVNQSSRLHMAGNNIFYSLYPPSSPPSPCNGYCWPMPPGAVPGIFYHLNKLTQQRTDLPDKQFTLFSNDGSKTILSSTLNNRIYLFDNNSRSITDSIDRDPSNYISGLFYNSNVLKAFEIDIQGKITIKNSFTGQVLHQLQSNYMGFSDLRVSTDGTKLYYREGNLNGGSIKIILYDIARNTERVIADIPYLAGGSISVNSFVLSDDNTKMAMRYQNDIYVKELQ